MPRYLKPTLKHYIYDLKISLYENINALQNITRYTELSEADKIKLVQYEAQLNLLKEFEQVIRECD